jgi:hypothetical protein
MGMDIPIKPPAEWFSPPEEIPTDRRITITADGRVYGYIALWDTCHSGLEGCLRPPKGSPSDYGYAHQGETELEDGTIIATANIGGGAGHASLDEANAAVPSFYENTNTQLMRVRYGEDDKGLWFAGALWPDVNELDIAKIRASPISGDWRWLGSWRESESGYDFAGACFVNIPGYPMANAGDVSLTSGQMQNIAASISSGETFSPPAGVVEAVKRGLKWHEEGHSGAGLRPKTVSEAKSMASGEKQSLDKLTRMRAWFARHSVDRSAKNREDDKPTPGEVAWELWGGDAGQSWAEGVMTRAEKGSIAATAMDVNGNILAMYAVTEKQQGDTMPETTCGSAPCDCQKAEEKCPCGKVEASACDCDGANITASADMGGKEGGMDEAVMAKIDDAVVRIAALEEAVATLVAARTAAILSE